MRYLLIDEGNDYDPAAGARHGIGGVYFALRDPRVTRSYLLDQRRYGAVGVYAAWNWPEYASGTGREFAEKVALDVAALRAPGDPTTFPRVQLNDETHSAERIADAIQAWRRVGRSLGMRYLDTSLSIEGLQGGWMRDCLDAVVRARVRVSPQAYTGSMERFAEDAVLRDLTRHGYPEKIVSLTYDAAQLPAQQSWSGWAFTSGRLS